ncbi:MAG: hypothetical protein ACK6DP_12455 [Gemmatimonas sp.]|jgi:hypothetical protein|uniref:hypothetical protein n=1 Tax=Gemmatimonas sp. TaxID=1962908 RepID=UPI00391FC788
MKYTHTPHPTTYAGVRFRSRLEARWAAFFDLCQWSWDYEPVELAGWAPDFLVHVSSEITNTRVSLYAEVKPYTALEQFHDHTAWSMMDGAYEIRPAVLGVSPVVSEWREIARPHHARSNLPALLPSWARLWKAAGNAVQWRPR